MTQPQKKNKLTSKLDRLMHRFQQKFGKVPEHCALTADDEHLLRTEPPSSLPRETISKITLQGPRTAITALFGMQVMWDAPDTKVGLPSGEWLAYAEIRPALGALGLRVTSRKAQGRGML